MKLPRIPVFVAVGVAAVVLVLGVALPAAPSRTASAASFARPDFAAATGVRAINLSLYSAIGRRDEMRTFAKNPAVCRDALDAAGVFYQPQEPIRSGKGCGVEDAVILDKARLVNKGTEPLEMTCALAARLYTWQEHIVAPAAEKYLGSPLTRIEALGAYSCRTIAGETKMSEHAFGKAADISGFRLADGRTISVLGDYYDRGPRGQFLREIHAKACDLFDVTLGPDYNAAHKNHFHLDVGIDRACH